VAKLRTGRPLWLDLRRSPVESTRPPRFSRHRGNLSVEVVIVGGGITGAIAAYTFAESGLAVALVEARRIGRGSTAASTALLMREPDKDFRELAQRYGPLASRSIWEAIGRATKDLVALIRRLKISCGLREANSIYYTVRADDVGDLRKEFEARRNARLGARWLSGRGVKQRTGISAAAGILMSGNAQLNPYEACVGFVHHALGRGARVFENSPVRRVQTAGDGVEVFTRDGSLRAKCVLVTTGYATPEFKPLAGRFRMMKSESLKV
jgi:glycine/D-amino acid oxidase-like deaminating enzyme